MRIFIRGSRNPPSAGDTMANDIAYSLKHLPEEPLLAAALDGSPLEDAIDSYLSSWRPNLLERKPALIYTEGDNGEPLYKTGSLDLFTVLLALSENQQVISIDDYHRMRVRQQERPGQRILTPEHRHGQVNGVTSNQEFHSFSVRVWDLSVETLFPDGAKLGDWRNFALVDVFGRTRPGYDTGKVAFNATPEQLAFLKGRGMNVLEAPVEFEHFVHPQLYKAAFGRRYVVGKALAELVPKEREYWKSVEKRLGAALRSEGTSLDEVVRSRKGTGGWHESDEEKGASEPVLSVSVPGLVAEVSMPLVAVQHPWYGLSADGAKRELPQDLDRLSSSELEDFSWYIHNRKSELSYTLGPRIRAPLRAVELALYLKLIEGHDQTSISESELGDLEEGISTLAESAGWPVPAPKDALLRRTECHRMDFGNGYAMNYWLRHKATKVVESDLSGDVAGCTVVCK